MRLEIPKQFRTRHNVKYLKYLECMDWFELNLK